MQALQRKEAKAQGGQWCLWVSPHTRTGSPNLTPWITLSFVASLLPGFSASWTDQLIGAVGD